jgi:hypothetical protein
MFMNLYRNRVTFKLCLLLSSLSLSTRSPPPDLHYLNVPDPAHRSVSDPKRTSSSVILITSPFPIPLQVPSLNLCPNATALSSSLTSVGSDYMTTSDFDTHGRIQSPQRRHERSPNPRSDFNFAAADDAGRVLAPQGNRERSPRLYSNSDSDAKAAIGGGRVSSLRRTCDRSPRLHSDSDNFVASEDVGEGNASPLPHVRRSTRIETSKIKPVSVSSWYFYVGFI